VNNQHPAVELVDIWKRFDDVAAVRGVSLEIGQGEFYAFLGPSGCGKTTTLRMIAGFESPTQGVIRLSGREINREPPHRRNVNMVFQNYALFPHLTVFDNVAFSLQVKRVPMGEVRGRVSEALDMVRLAGLERRKPAQLSGGQQQRVALARALVNRPAVLLLDEPLGALDQKLRKDMQLELKRLQREVGITFIYVTHDQEEALTMSDRIAVMHQGRVLQVGSPREIYDCPATRFVADFIGTMNFLTGGVLSEGDGAAVIEVADLGRFRAPPARGLVAGQEVTLAIRPERIRLLGPDAPAEGESLHGSLEEVLFVGNDTQYLVRLANGGRLMAREQNQLPASRDLGFQVGQRVQVCWAPASVNLLLE
jgi:spermidine/putrescine transport system ATP-binding protein